MELSLLEKQIVILNKNIFGEKSLAYFMSKENSLDIDDSLDFEIAIQIMTKI